MNEELVSRIKSEINKYVLMINDLREKYNKMQKEGTSVAELNKVAREAQDLFNKCGELKKDLADYTNKYNVYANEAGKKVLKDKDANDKKLKDAHDSFIALQISLLFKYNLNAEVSETQDEEIEVVSHTKPKHKLFSKFLAGVLSLTTIFGLGYGLTACHNKNVDSSNNISIIQNEDETREPYDEPVINETTKPDVTEEIEVPEIETTVPSIEETNPVNENYQILNDFAFLTENSSLYDSDTEDKNEVEKIEKYQKVLRLSTDGNYDFVQTEDMKYGYIESSKLEVLPELYVEVDLSDQSVELYKDNDIILTTLCVTGKDSTPTRIGYFPIKYKTYDTYLKGPGYNSHVYYWMPFDGGIGLHDAAWRDEFGGDIHFNNGSHGCVNMPHDAAKTIYENVSTGTKVLVHN